MSGTEGRLSGYRQRRDHFFGHHAHSPLTDEQRSRFAGLSYFPEREDLAFMLSLDDSGESVGEDVDILTTDGRLKPFVRAGHVRFEVDGEPVTLTVFRDGDHGSLFIPFRDAGAGRETYGIGRYLEPQGRPDGTLHSDFNYAYNPFCAYGAGWSCPIPPRENHLTVTIAAGERAFTDVGRE